MNNFASSTITILSGLVVGFILGCWSGLFANALSIRREATTRRRIFCGLLRSQIQNFELVDWRQFEGGELFDIHKDTLRLINEPCAHISEDIGKRNRIRFQVARKTFASLKKTDVEAYKAGNDSSNPQPSLFPQYELGIKKIVDLLEEMIDCAK